MISKTLTTPRVILTFVLCNKSMQQLPLVNKYFHGYYYKHLYKFIYNIYINISLTYSNLKWQIISNDEIDNKIPMTMTMALSNIFSIIIIHMT